ncbi:MAG: hypothetical protein JWM28_4154 [Chitinophagaceae bacterium]|nr:hypothetical protein [Chitinophagaceae bacterium]
MKPIFTLLLISFLICSCSTIKTTGYFNLKENQIESYNGYFIKDEKDTDYKKIEQIFGSISEKDTVIDKTEIIYKTIEIEGHKAFYAVETIDTLQKNPSIGPRHYLFSSLLFFNDTTFVAPVYEKADLEKLKFKDFKYKIPPRLTKTDSVVIIDGKKKMVLQNFKKTKLSLGNKSFSNCLHFDLKEVWPDTLYIGKVWLHRQYGLLKWIRSTGRIETRKL